LIFDALANGSLDCVAQRTFTPTSRPPSLLVTEDPRTTLLHHDEYGCPKVLVSTVENFSPSASFHGNLPGTPVPLVGTQRVRGARSTLRTVRFSSLTKNEPGPPLSLLRTPSFNARRLLGLSSPAVRLGVSADNRISGPSALLWNGFFFR